MGRRPGLSIDDRNIALGLLEGAVRVPDIARRFGCHERTIYRLQSRFRHGSVKDLARSGRPRKTTPREDRYPVTSSRRERFMPATKLAQRLRHATGTRISAHTARNRLRAARFRARRPYNGVPLSANRRLLRLNWSRRYSRWLRNQWNRVVFTDESKLNLDWADGRIRVWRRRGERFDPANVIECDNYGGGSVMIWGGISHQGKTELLTVQNRLNAARYCDEINLPIVVPYIQNGNADVFQQDNTRCHTARHTQHVLAENNINTLDGLRDHQICRQ